MPPCSCLSHMLHCQVSPPASETRTLAPSSSRSSTQRRLEPSLSLMTRTSTTIALYQRVRRNQPSRGEGLVQMVAGPPGRNRSRVRFPSAGPPRPARSAMFMGQGASPPDARDAPEADLGGRSSGGSPGSCRQTPRTPQPSVETAKGMPSGGAGDLISRRRRESLPVWPGVHVRPHRERGYCVALGVNCVAGERSAPLRRSRTRRTRRRT
jgi:hypothetical protein